MSTNLTQASRQWSSRPDDERFLSLEAMRNHFETIRSESQEKVIPSRRLHALPTPDNEGMHIVDPDGRPYAPTHWSFGQVAQLAEAPAGYMRTMPSPIAADCINYGLQYKRAIEDVGVLVRHNQADLLRAATGPRYGRIWNDEVISALQGRFGDGVTGQWRVPGIFGVELSAVTKQNTTLFASDRDMFVFLADEKNRIEVPARRNGQPGSLARGFFVWNSEVGNKSFGVGTFLFDYVCCNRIVWGAQHYHEVRIRHTASAPDKFLEEMEPALVAFSNASTRGITEAIEHARAKRVSDTLDDFLAKRFGKRLVAPIKAMHEAEEGRPIETHWDIATAVTAYARSIEHQDRRVELERDAGKLLQLVAA
jgi:hypothetical protein